MQRIEQLSDGRRLFYTRSTRRRCTRCGQAPRGGVGPRRVCVHRLAPTRMMRFSAGESLRAQAVYTDPEPLLELIVMGRLPTMVKAGLELVGPDIGHPRRPLLRLGDEGRAALKQLLTDAGPQHRVRRGSRRSALRREDPQAPSKKDCRERDVFAFFQHNKRAG